MRRIGYTCAGLVCLIAMTDCASAEDWFRHRGPTLNGRSTEVDWTHQWGESGPTKAWKADVGVGVSGIVSAEGRVYTMGNRDDVDSVFCFDLATGKQLWRHQYACPTDPNEFSGGPTSTPTIDDDRVFTMSRTGDLFSFDAASGEVAWQVNLPTETGIRIPAWGFSGSPLVQGDRVYLNVGDAGVAVDRNRGEVIWASQDKDCGYASPVPCKYEGNEAIIFGSARSYVCVGAESGEEYWRHRWLTTFGCNAADAILTGDHVFLSSGYNRGSALIRPDGDKAETIWKHKDFQNQISTSVLVDQHLYGATGDVDAGPSLACIELSTGAVRWREESIAAAALTSAGERLVVLTVDGELVIVAAHSGQCQTLSRARVLNEKCWAVPVLTSGRILCRSNQGTVVCLDVRQGE